MPRLEFNDIAVTAVVTTVGDQCIPIDEEKEHFGFDDISLNRLKQSIGLQTRYIASEGITTSDLCVQSAEAIFKDYRIDPRSVDALLFVTQSPDYKAPSTAIIMQDRLGMGTDTCAFDINLGCSGFVYGLMSAYSYINSGMNRVLLCVGDVNRHFAGEKDKVFTPLMGDAGSAVLVERKPGAKAFFTLHSDGSGYEHLIIPSGGARHPTTPKSLTPKLREDGAVRRDEDLRMNGKEVFNFAVKTVPPLVDEILKFAGKTADEIDYFVLHQANRYILQTISRKLGLTPERLPLETGVIYGNQNAASIPGTINGFLSDPFQTRHLRLIVAGFGIGLSWGAAYIETDSIFAPPTKIYEVPHD